MTRKVWTAAELEAMDPAEVDAIPASCPHYNVKYVYIYDVTPEVWAAARDVLRVATDAIGAGLDQTGVVVGLSEPAVDHRIVAADQQLVNSRRGLCHEAQG